MRTADFIENGSGQVAGGFWSVPFLTGGKNVLFRFLILASSSSRVGEVGARSMPFLMGKKICFISFSYYCFVVESGLGRGLVGAVSYGKMCFVSFSFSCLVGGPRARVTYRDVSLFFFFYRRVLGGETGRFEQPAAAGLPTLACVLSPRLRTIE